MSSPIKKVYIKFNYSPNFQLLKCMLSREISLQRSPKFSIATAILNQVLSGQAAKRDVIPTYLNSGSLKCSWLSSTLSGFSCLVSCVKMPSCSAPGCSNRSDKDPEKRLSFHNLPFRNKKLAKKWLDQLRRDARFMTKNLRMSTFERTLDKGLLRSQLQIRNVGCEDKKAEDTKENAVLKTQYKVP